MITLPINIAKYIHSIWMTEMVAAYLRVDEYDNLVDWGGQPQHYGLLDLSVGQPVTDQLTFLEGILPIQERLVLPFLKLGEGRSAHVHIVPCDNNFWVLLFDANSEHQQIQQMRQQINELRISVYKQSQVIQKLERQNRQLKRTHAQQCRFIAKKLQSLAIDCKRRFY